MAKKRVAIYARRSDETGDRDRSIVEQVDICRRWADERGHSVVRVYEELGSGTSGEDRAIFCAMVADAQKKPRPFDTILVLDISRFGRTDNDEAGYWKHTLRKAGVSVSYVLDGEALEGPAGQIVGAVLQMAARDHSVKTAFKVAAGQLAVVKAGFWPGGACPYGYRFVRSPNWTGKGRRETKLVVHEGEAAIVRRIYALREKGLGHHTIAKTLNADTVPGPRGGSWDRVTIRKILENRAYVGDLVRSRHRRRSKFYTATETGVVPVEKSNGAGLITTDAVPVIVEHALFDRVQRLACGKRTKPSGGMPGLLTGLARCRVCGGRLGLKGARPQGHKRYRYYRCDRRYEHGGGPDQCGCVTIRADFCEEAVLKAVQAAVAKLDAASFAAEVHRLIAVNVPATYIEAL
ncbi:MAG: recombinase family protein, partial [Solirubrobacteraceae bacterium]